MTGAAIAPATPPYGELSRTSWRKKLVTELVVEVPSPRLDERDLRRGRVTCDAFAVSRRLLILKRFSRCVSAAITSDDAAESMLLKPLNETGEDTRTP